MHKLQLAIKVARKPLKTIVGKEKQPAPETLKKPAPFLLKFMLVYRLTLKTFIVNQT